MTNIKRVLKDNNIQTESKLIKCECGHYHDVNDVKIVEVKYLVGKNCHFDPTPQTTQRIQLETSQQFRPNKEIIRRALENKLREIYGRELGQEGQNVVNELANAVYEALQTSSNFQNEKGVLTNNENNFESQPDVSTTNNITTQPSISKPKKVVIPPTFQVNTPLGTKTIPGISIFQKPPEL